MRERLLDILRCPQCGARELELRDAVSDGTEIRKASIACGGCGSSYRVENGIATVMPKVREAVATEINAWSDKMDQMGIAGFDQEMRDTYRRMMLSLPYITEEFEKDGYARLQWHAFGERFGEFVLKDELRGSTVLDVGAGRCWTTTAIAEKGADAVALDILTKIYIGLETADIYIEERGAFFERVQGDMHDLPFRDGAFDLVVESVSAHHAEEPDLFFREVRRVLKPGGRFALVSEPIAWKDDELPPEVEEGITEKQIGLFEWFRLFSRAGLVPERSLVEYGKSLCCVLVRKGDRPWWREAAQVARFRLVATLNWLLWKFVFWERERYPEAEGALRRVPTWSKRVARRLLIALDLPTSARVLVPSRAFMGSLASDRSGASEALSFGSEDASAWLGPGWYGVDTRLDLPAQRAYRNASLMMSIPEDARALEIALGLPEQCEFECPVAVRVLLGGTEVAVLSLNDADVRSHSVEIPPSMRGRTVRLSFRAKRATARNLSSRLRRCRALGFVLESASAVRDPR